MFNNVSFIPKDGLCHSVVSSFLQSHGWTVASQAPLFMDFFRQEYWSGLPFPTPEILKDRVKQVTNQ